jgi:hypothetical protein
MAVGVGRELRFSLVLDEQSFARVKRAIQDLTVEAEKMQKAMSGGVAGAGGTGSLMTNANIGNVPGSAARTQAATVGSSAKASTVLGSSFVNTIQRDVEHMKMLAIGGSDALKKMTQETINAVSAQVRELEKLQTAKDKLLSKHGAYGGATQAQVAAILDPERRETIRAQQALMADARLAQEDAYDPRDLSRQRRRDNVPWYARPAWSGYDPTGPSRWSQVKQFATDGWLSQHDNVTGDRSWFGGAIASTMPKGFGGWARAGGIAMMGANAILDSTIQNNAMANNISNNRRDALAVDIDKRYRVDVRDAVAAQLGVRNMSSESRREMALAIGGDAAIAAQRRGAFYDSTVGSILNMVGMGSGNGTGNWTGAGFTDTQQGTDAIRRAQAQREVAMKEMPAEQRLALDYIVMGQAGQRRTRSHLLGLGLYVDREKTAANIKAATDAYTSFKDNRLDETGMTLTPQHFAAYQQSNAGWEHKRRLIAAKAKAETEPVIDAAKQAKGLDLTGKIARWGLSEEEYMGGVASSIGLGLGGAYAASIAGASNAGYGGYGQMLAKAGQDLNSTDAAARQAAYFFGLGGGKINKQAAMRMGDAMMGWDVRGVSSAEALIGSFQNGGMAFGVNASQDANLVNRALAGTNLMDAVVGGKTSPYQQGRNILTAYDANPGGSFMANDYLANGMSWKQLLAGAKGEVGDMAQTLGLGQGNFQKQISGSVSSVFDSAALSATDTTPQAMALRRLRASGKSSDEYIQAMRKAGNTDELKSLSGLFATITGQGYEAGAGAIASIAGMKEDALVSGHAPYGKTDDIATTQSIQQADNEKKLQVEVATVFTAVMAEMVKNPEMLKKLVAISENQGMTERQTIALTGEVIINPGVLVRKGS